MEELKSQIKIKDIELVKLKEENRLLVKQHHLKKDVKRHQFSEVRIKFTSERSAQLRFSSYCFTCFSTFIAELYSIPIVIKFLHNKIINLTLFVNFIASSQ